MEAADTIRHAVNSVARIREETSLAPALLASVGAIKRFQALRFRHTYADLLESSEFGAPTSFFLNELYGEKDFAERDAQFGRIAGALQTLFPKQVVQTAVALALLHRLTEEMDHAMGKARLLRGLGRQVPYAKVWADVGRRHDRERQLETVLQVGAELDRFTKMRGLRAMLRVMRGPANAAGLGALQQFLETGFDTFALMSGKRSLAVEFLETIRLRETALIDFAFNNPESTDESLLQRHSSRF